MNITLRKANTIQTAISDLLKVIDFNTTVTITEFQDPNHLIDNAEKTFAANLTRRDNLLTALYEIRKMVSKGNEAAGISERLATVAHLEKQIQFFSGLASRPAKDDTVVIEGKLNKIRNRKEDSRASLYGRDDEVSTSILEKDELEGFRQLVAQSKKQKQHLQDEILEMNVRTEFSLTGDTVKTLQAEGII
jgi:hypothetical protein